MLYSPVLDSVAGVVLAYFLIVGIGNFITAIFVETIILWWKGWGVFSQALLTSFVMNLVSAVVGYLLTIFSAVNLNAGGFFLLFVLSVGIEGGIMWRMGRDRFEVLPIWRMALVVNVVSYILLAIGLGLLLN